MITNSTDAGVDIDLPYFFQIHNCGTGVYGYNTFGEVRAIELLQAIQTKNWTQQTWDDFRKAQAYERAMRSEINGM